MIVDSLDDVFKGIDAKFQMTWRLYDADVRDRKFPQGLTELHMTFPAISLAHADIRTVATANAAGGELPSRATTRGLGAGRKLNLSDELNEVERVCVCHQIGHCSHFTRP
jgi:hypothetical protein